MNRYSSVIMMGFVALVSSGGFSRPRDGSLCLEGHPSVRREYRESWAVFVGKVKSSRETPEAPLDWLDGTLYTVQVAQIFRGSPPKQIDLFSEHSTGRFEMDSAVAYLLFVNRMLGRTVVDNCGNSRLLSEADAVLDTIRHFQQTGR